MKYLFEGTKLKLIKYEVTYTPPVVVMTSDEKSPKMLKNQNNTQINEVPEEIEMQTIFSGNSDQTFTRTVSITSEEEKNNILKNYPDAEVTLIDNTGYEWLDGRNFEESEKASGMVEKAIEMGQEAYEQYVLNSDPNAQMLDVMYRITLLEQGVNVNDLSVD